ncbi:MAG: deoxyribose-phosphate aldolase [Anaerolineaceae bacterium]|nr:deoxyribose-phosphate aldolase [Anaerolineaceae bacterium]
MNSEQSAEKISITDLARMIDHTLLKPEASEKQVLKLCREAIENGFGAVCVNPCWVSSCVKALEGSEVKVATVIGFPLGASTTEAKKAEAADALKRGAQELDMVLNIGQLKSGMVNDAAKDIHGIAVLAHKHGALLKVILETCLLTDEEKELASQLAVQAGSDFVKTSTGFSSGGATAEDVALMRESVGPKIGVKASGGIRSYADALKMIAAGANRLGCSAGVQIIQEAKAEG